LKVKTFAKLNLYLKVFTLRSDGFHDIISVMQTVSLADEMVLIPEGDNIVIECDDPLVPTDESNTVARVYQYFLRRYPEFMGGVRVRINKNIPTQAGLAGGSGNAAGTIFALNELFKLPLDDTEMLKCALSVGSDVPFLLKGGCAIIKGRGEFVDKLHGVAGKFYIIVVPPGERVETASAFKLVDEVRERTTHKIGTVDEVYRDAYNTWISALSSGQFEGLLHNDFEEAVFPTHPVIGEVKDRLTHLGAKAFMTGSGSAVFTPVNDYSYALDLLGKMQAAYGDDVHLCETVPNGVEIYD